MLQICRILNCSLDLLQLGILQTPELFQGLQGRPNLRSSRCPSCLIFAGCLNLNRRCEDSQIFELTPKPSKFQTFQVPEHLSGPRFERNKEGISFVSAQKENRGLAS